MKVLIVSDIHGNWPALAAVLKAEPQFDRVLCLGDLVNYGPMPVECVAWAREVFFSGIFLQGNHDRALGWGENPHCSPAYKTLAAATQVFSERMLAPELKQFLGRLKPLRHFQWQGAKCVACHARPKDPLYGYLTEEASVARWESEVVQAGLPDMLFLGHTHLPMKTRLMNTLLVNPGSVGQPKNDDPRAAFAVWEDGDVTLRRAAYDVEETIRAYDGLGLKPEVERALCAVLRTGGHLPVEQSQSLKCQTI
jgi:putative phosphoesterase